MENGFMRYSQKSLHYVISACVRKLLNAQAVLVMK
jgi:hypothetical protein